MMGFRIQLSDHFDYWRLLRFTMPTVLMMLFSSFYGVVDGLFVANYAGKTAFAAVNLIWPYPMVIGALGYMFGTGGCALVSKTLGEGNSPKSRGYFTMLLIVAFSIGCLISTIGYFYVEDVVRFLGATEGELWNDCVVYGKLIMCSMPFFIMQTMFQPFMIAAEKPTWGFGIILAAGLININLDALLIAFFNKGVEGAGVATLISQVCGTLLPCLFFALHKPSNLYFSKPIFNWQALRKACTNGSSEFIVNASMPIVNLIYVYLLWKTCGENGVGAYGVIMYVNVVFFSVYTGFSMGSAPIISYNFGAGKMSEVQNVKKRIIKILGVSAVSVVVLAELLAPLVAKGFAHGDANFRNMIYEAFALYAISFLVAPFNIFASSFFTALNNGRVSAIIAFSRIFLFQIGAMLLLPIWLGTNGYWAALPVAEALCLITTIYFYVTRKPIYNY